MKLSTIENKEGIIINSICFTHVINPDRHCELTVEAEFVNHPLYCDGQFQVDFEFQGFVNEKGDYWDENNNWYNETNGMHDYAMLTYRCDSDLGRTEYMEMTIIFFNALDIYLAQMNIRSN